MQCDILSGKDKVGFLRWQQQGLYTRFYGEVTVRSVSRVYARFEQGSCSLGVPVPEQGKMVLRASMPTSRLPKGKLLQGELEEGGWNRFPGGVLGGVSYPPGLRKGDTLRFPWKMGEKLPVEEVMLLFSYGEAGGESYLELTLNPDGSPKVPQ